MSSPSISKTANGWFFEVESSHAATLLEHLRSKVGSFSVDVSIATTSSSGGIVAERKSEFDGYRVPLSVDRKILDKALNEYFSEK